MSLELKFKFLSLKYDIEQLSRGITLANTELLDSKAGSIPATEIKCLATY